MTNASEAAAKKQAADNKQNQGAQNSNEQAAAEKAAAEKEAAEKAAAEKEAAEKAAAEKEAAEKAAAEKEAAEKEAAEKEAANKAANKAAAAAEKNPANSVKVPAEENVNYFIDKPKPAVTFERDGMKYRLRGQVFHIGGTRITAAELVLPENKAILDKLFEMKSAIIQEAFE